MAILAVDGLRVATRDAQLLHGISFALEPGTRLGLIGESGSGKSLTALAIMGLLGKGLTASGSIRLEETELIGLPDSQMRALRGKRIAMVFQEPMNALDPLMRVGKQLSFAIPSSSSATVTSMLELVALDPKLAKRFPHELSGGQRQRVMIAMAMAGDPDVLICDEPTTALDATTEAGVLDVIDELVAQRGTALLFISHDLNVIARLCPEVAVMRRGEIVETGHTATVLTAPKHEYTQTLVDAARPGPVAAQRATDGTAIAIADVTKTFGPVTALADIDLTVARGQRVGIVGGSGSGKTTLLNLIAGLDQPTSGSVDVDGRVQMVFQDPQGSLNPRLPIWKIVAEGIPRDRTVEGKTKAAIKDSVARALTDVGIDPAAMNRYPHEFSGGQRQRISIARAVIGNPDILLADEAVSALDVSVRAQVLKLLEELADKYQLTLVFVTHDLPVIRQICSDVVVMDSGRIVESGTVATVWDNPQHDYTRSLLAAGNLAPES